MSLRASVLALAAAMAVLAGAPPARAAAPGASGCSESVAARLYSQARRAFEEKRYDDSITLLREANECAPNPVYLANIARAYEEAGRPKDALAAWRSYLAVVNDPRERARAEGRIQALGKAVEDEEQADRAASDAAARQPETPASAPTTTAPPQEASRPRVSAAALIVTGVGVVALGAGVFFGLKAGAKHDDAVAEPAVDRADSLQSSARDLGHAANVTLVAGALVAAGGLVWVGLDLFRSRSATVGVGPRGVAFRATF